MKLKFTLETSLFLGKTFIFFHNSLIILTVLSGFDTTYLSSFSLSSFVYHCLVFKVQPILNMSYPYLSVRIGGDEENRTPDPLLARQVLSQLSYTPRFTQKMGSSGLEPPTSRLSGVRSNRLSYEPIGFRRPSTLPGSCPPSTIDRLGLNRRVRNGNGCVP